jgi:hypothetical protein
MPIDASRAASACDQRELPTPRFGRTKRSLVGADTSAEHSDEIRNAHQGDVAPCDRFGGSNASFDGASDTAGPLVRFAGESCR